MDTQQHGVAKRLILSLAAATAAAALSGCAVYGPPYAAYEPAPVAAPYYYPYTYGGPAWLGPPISLDFGFYEHGYRGGYGGYHGGYRGYRGYGGHAWRGGLGGRGYGWGGGRGGYGGGGFGRR
jgi:hypothetical protein